MTPLRVFSPVLHTTVLRKYAVFGRLKVDREPGEVVSGSYLR